MKQQKKYIKILKKYGYLFSVLFLFSLLEMVGIGRSLVKRQCNWNTIKKHISEPFWEELLFSESNVVSVKKQKQTQKEQLPVKVKEAEEKTVKEKEGKEKVTENVANQKREKTEKNHLKAGVTHFETYTPVKVKVPYYTDRGKIPQTTVYQYETVTDDYFSDAAFIGDSRTLGLYDYSGWGNIADVYCESGFSLYQWTQGAMVTCQNIGKKVDLKAALAAKTYGKVYLMIGMNDLGYGTSKKYAKWLSQMVDMIKQTQPKAIIYLMGNLHMSREKDNRNTEFNNINVNDKNVSMAYLADGVSSFYLDCNSLYTDKEGYLKSELTFDGCHIYGYHYKEWTDFIKQHAIKKEK